MKKLLLLMGAMLISADIVLAKTSDYDKYFRVDMNMEIPEINEYIKKLDKTYNLYDKGYESRFKMGNNFKKEFSQTIRTYGMSEGRLKNSYEDDLMELISWLPKESYQYIGPMLHQIPGMSEKILNMPGIKETKNKFPEDVAERMKGIENIEFMSPALYFILMPEIWGEKKPEKLDAPKPKRVKKPKVTIDLPDYLKEKADIPTKVAEKKPASAVKKQKPTSIMAGKLRTLSPNLTSPLTSKDVGAFVNTIDSIIDFGMRDNMRNFSKLIIGESLLDIWEQEQGTALMQNSLKDIVNPCQRLVLKTRFAGLYNEFASVVIKEGFSPEEWAYTCDKTIKAFRVLEANQTIAYAVRYHRRGYYDEYISQLPTKWREEMFATEAAIIKMYSVFKEDVEVVRPYHKSLSEKFLKNKGMMLTAPIFY